MTEEEMKAIAEAATKAASAAVTQATVKMGEDFSALKSENEGLKKIVDDLNAEVKAGKAEVHKMGETLVKATKGFGGVSIVKDLGAGKSELSFSKAKMYRGMATDNWIGADKERAIAEEVRTRAIQAGVGTDGGYALFEELSTDLITLIRERNPFEKLPVMRLNLDAYHFKMPRVTGGSTGYWTGENAEITESDMKFGLITLEPRKAAALVYASKEMVNSASNALVQVIENDIADAIVAQMVVGLLYGNGIDNRPLGLANIPGITKYNPTADTNGTSPSKASMRAVRANVPSKYLSNSGAFLGHENAFLKMAETISATISEAVLLSDEELILKSLNKPYVSTGHIVSNKTKASGTGLSDMFYGLWNEFVLATWWGGMTMESTTIGGKAFANDAIAFKSVLPVNCAVRREDAFVHAQYVQTITLQ